MLGEGGGCLGYGSGSSDISTINALLGQDGRQNGTLHALLPLHEVALAWLLLYCIGRGVLVEQIGRADIQSVASETQRE